MQKHLFSSKNFLQRPIRYAECRFRIVFHADRSIFFKTSESGKVCEMRFEAQESVIAHLVEGGKLRLFRCYIRAQNREVRIFNAERDVFARNLNDRRNIGT